MEIQNLQLIITIVGSVLGSSVIAAFIQGRYLVKEKKLIYENDYKKLIINKRLKAYSRLEQILSILSSSTPHPDERSMIHTIFFDVEYYSNFSILMTQVNSSTIWFDEHTERKFGELKFLFIQLNIKGFEVHQLQEFGAKNYKRIAELRTELFQCLLNDYKNLSDLKNFQSKRLTNEYLSV